MTEHDLKVKLGVTLVASHFGILILLMVLFAAGGFKFEDLTTSVAIIVPMFAGFSTAVTTFIVDDRHSTNAWSPRVSSVYTMMSFAFPLVFTLILASAILAQSFGLVFKDFEQFKLALVLIEGIFAVYVGRFVYSMFEPPRSPVAASNSGTRGPVVPE
jgi:hypothetical protein